jgi:hypothetical protein
MQAEDEARDPLVEANGPEAETWRLNDANYVKAG